MPDNKDKLFFADNVYFVWNTAVTLIDSLSLPDEVEKGLLSLFEVCNKYLLDIGKWEVDTFTNVDED